MCYIINYNNILFLHKYFFSIQNFELCKIFKIRFKSSALKFTIIACSSLCKKIFVLLYSVIANYVSERGPPVPCEEAINQSHSIILPCTEHSHISHISTAISSQVAPLCFVLVVRILPAPHSVFSFIALFNHVIT